MKNANRYGAYDCPHGKHDGIAGDMVGKRKTKFSYSVGGRFCKNNCERYKKSCGLFK